MPQRNGGTTVQKVTTAQAGRHVSTIGRPPKYNTAVAKMAEHCISKLFMTDEETCRTIGISPASWYVWRNKYPAFREATTRAKEVANKAVEASLFKTATGYAVPAVRIFMTDEVTETISKRGKRTITRRQVPVSVGYQEHIPGEYKAQVTWLERRNAQRWHRSPTEAPPVVAAGEEEARKVAWRKMIAMLKQNAAEGGQPLLTTLPADATAAEEATDVTPTLAGVKK